MVSYRFPSSARLLRRAEFAAVQSSGSKLFSKHFLILYAPRPIAAKGSRIGITITKKVDARATGRNKLRRRIREIFRHVRSEFIGNFDILVIARNNAVSCSLQDISRELLGALRFGKLLPRGPRSEASARALNK